MTKGKILSSTRKFIDKETKKGSLFILEKYLTALPWDFFDAVSFIYSNGIDQNRGSHVLILDDDESEEFFKILNKEMIKLIVFSEKKINDRKIIWSLLMTREKVDGHEDPKSLFIGGEHLREFCDKHNLWYRTMYYPDGTLISGSALRFLKKPNEDCRKPQNENPLKIKNE